MTSKCERKEFYVSGQPKTLSKSSSKGNQDKWFIDGFWVKADFLGYEGLAMPLNVCIRNVKSKPFATSFSKQMASLPQESIGKLQLPNNFANLNIDWDYALLYYSEEEVERVKKVLSTQAMSFSLKQTREGLTASTVFGTRGG